MMSARSGRIAGIDRGMFVLSGGKSGVSRLKASYDGITWWEIPGPSGLFQRDATYAPRHDVLLTSSVEGTVSQTRDPQTSWQTASAFGDPLTEIYWANAHNQCVALFSTRSGTLPRLYTSQNLTTWTPRATQADVATGKWHAVAQSDTAYAVVGEVNGLGAISSGLQPTVWVTRESTLSQPLISLVGYGNRFMAGGENGGSWKGGGDGITWTQVGTVFAGGELVQGLASDGSRVVAVGGPSAATGRTAYTDNHGTTWTEAALTGSNQPRDIAYSPGAKIYVAGDFTGKTFTSTDGITWTDRGQTFPTGESILGVAVV